MDWKAWFESHKYEQYLLTGSCVGQDGVVSFEEVYEAFKARMIEELRIESAELLEPATLRDRSGDGLSGGIYLCPKHGGYGFASDCSVCFSEGAS